MAIGGLPSALCRAFLSSGSGAGVLMRDYVVIPSDIVKLSETSEEHILV